MGVELILDVQATTKDGTLAPLESRASRDNRANLIRILIDLTQAALGTPLGIEALGAFIPSFKNPHDRRPAKFMDRIGGVLAGHGVTQPVYAELLQVFWRLPQAAGCLAIQPPPQHLPCFRSMRYDGPGRLFIFDSGRRVFWPTNDRAAGLRQERARRLAEAAAKAAYQETFNAFLNNTLKEAV